VRVRGYIVTSRIGRRLDDEDADEDADEDEDEVSEPTKPSY